VERLRQALENLDQAIDAAEDAIARRNKDFEKIVEGRAAKRVKAATETAERALKQARDREQEATTREGKQRELTGVVAGRLDDAIGRLARLVGE
jgi:hypothetical protein